ncbi:MAG TPA: hypothetical protein VHC92_08775 [Rhodanobacteraceae bacterium]|jgi:hypothetical protein|nr:hypothetical protein [Rhodanobacteraceae bacterium]
MKTTRPKASGKSLTIRPLAACVFTALATALDGGASASAQTPHALSVKPNSTLPVTSCADDGSAGTLRSVVASAVSGDTVDLSQLDCSTITLEGGQIEVSVASLTLTGPGRDLLEIDGHDASRILFHSGTGTLTVNGLTLTRGRADTAIPSNPPSFEAIGGCVLSKASIAMTGSAVTQCNAIDGAGTANAAVGGGIYASGPIDLTDAIVSNNTASDMSSATAVAAGGGIVAAFSPITLTDSIVQDNVAESAGSATAGGVYGWFGKVRLTNSVIDGNFAGCDTTTVSCTQASGGGVVTFGYDQSLNTSSSTISNNTASASGVVRGGGFALFANSPHNFHDTQISDNTAFSADGAEKGGGGYLLGNLDVTGSTISGNSAGEGMGGGLFVYYGGVILENSTVSGNSAGNAGAIYNAHAVGYYNSNVPVLLFNSTITANTATWSGAPQGVTGGVLDTQTAFDFGFSEAASWPATPRRTPILPAPI